MESIAAIPVIIRAQMDTAVPTRNTQPTTLIQPQTQLRTGAQPGLAMMATQ